MSGASLTLAALGGELIWRWTGVELSLTHAPRLRSQRHAWAPFFDDANAIIFLAPVSAFDQVLAEDRSVNRLEDSVMLWKQICQNKLLQNIELILFLNKVRSSASFVSATQDADPVLRMHRWTSSRQNSKLASGWPSTCATLASGPTTWRR